MSSIQRNVEFLFFIGVSNMFIFLNNDLRRSLLTISCLAALSSSALHAMPIEDSEYYSINSSKSLRKEFPAQSLYNTALQWLNSESQTPSQKAITLLQHAAEQGNPDANYELGQLYARGSHVMQSFVAALHHFQTAIALDPNHYRSMNNLALLYVGDSNEVPYYGVPKDLSMAQTLFIIAKESAEEYGDKDAVNKITYSLRELAQDIKKSI